MVVRRRFDLEAELETLRELAEDERRRAVEKPLLSLTAEQERELEEFQALTLKEAQARHKELSLEASMQLTLLGIRERASAPYWFSDLSKWLGFETWKPRDALLLLAGVSPTAAIVDWTYENFMGATVDSPRIRAASDLDAIYDHYDLPERSAWDDEISEIKAKLRKSGDLSPADQAKLTEHLASLEQLRDGPDLIRRETELRCRSRILAALSSQWYSGDHDAERRYTPEHFVSWALERGFVPEWRDWATSQDLLVELNPRSAELFDPDSDDYPLLLHIAVRAWQFAKNGSAGTPKQRIEDFLSERYPKLSSNAREVIAQVANWQRSGGRPKT